MPSVQLKSEHAGKNDGSDVPRNVAHDRDDIKPRISLMPMLITLGSVAVATLLSWATWQTYMGAPWTRDGTVRAYVVTMAPEVAGRIVKLTQFAALCLASRLAACRSCVARSAAALACRSSRCTVPMGIPPY